RWASEDEGDQDAPSRWVVEDGELRQTSPIHGETPGAPADRPGTYALAGDPGWADYRASVRLRSDAPAGIGGMFRVTAAKHCYRFRLGTAPARRIGRLIKKVDGLVSVLWEHPGPYLQQRDYLVTVDCVADRLAVYLDGALVIAVDDPDLTAGQIGLYAW